MGSCAAPPKGEIEVRISFIRQVALIISLSAGPILLGCSFHYSQPLLYNQGNQIWKQYENGSSKVLLVQNGERPRWIHGTKTHFAYIERQAGNPNVKLWVAEYTGANPKALTGFQVRSEYGWSPDGKWLAVSHSKDGNYEIYKISADGTQQFRLTNNAYTDHYPRWSIHEDKIAFVSSRPTGSTERIFVMSSDGTGEKELLPPGMLNWYDSPDWDADGKKIAFVANQTPGVQLNIWIAEVATGKVTQVTNSGVNIDPKWLGNDLFFVTTAGQTDTVKRYDSSTGVTHTVGSFTNYLGTASFAVDPAYVYVSRQANVPGPITIYRIQAYTGEAVDLGPGREPDI